MYTHLTISFQAHGNHIQWAIGIFMIDNYGYVFYKMCRKKNMLDLYLSAHYGIAANIYIYISADQVVNWTSHTSLFHEYLLTMTMLALDQRVCFSIVNFIEF